ncbi:peptidase inhibitor family I36 protein [Allokutzneria sp. NRRL B-24872]|uniref:peptidase inhibitor family I36 protein n=1 Tax=Allokutzneria sp. NRRL B-24872 TaxID=1137961 RepID=UPI00143CDC59|nr:peptidase inhibitor family I36 protein [Allokutzneria sp. NRRL B-24872]
MGKVLAVGGVVAGALLATAPAQAAEATVPCSDGWICLYEHRDGRGASIAFHERSAGSDDLSKIPCPECQGGGTWDDRMSSYVNKTSRTWWAYDTAHGIGERHNLNPVDIVVNLGSRDEDQVSAIYPWG